jgi:hypothetical protein
MERCKLRTYRYIESISQEITTRQNLTDNLISYKSTENTIMSTEILIPKKYLVQTHHQGLLRYVTSLIRSYSSFQSYLQSSGSKKVLYMQIPLQDTTKI